MCLLKVFPSCRTRCRVSLPEIARGVHGRRLAHLLGKISKGCFPQKGRRKQDGKLLINFREVPYAMTLAAETDGGLGFCKQEK